MDQSGIIDLTDDDDDVTTRRDANHKKRKATQATKIFDGASFVENKKTKISETLIAAKYRSLSAARSQFRDQQNSNRGDEPTSEWNSKPTSTKLTKPTPTLPPVPPGVTFGKSQMKVISLVNEGKSVFFTGCAGTGKSTLLRYLINILPKTTTFVTAATGVAAVSIGGTTLHSFAGIGLGEGDNVTLALKVCESRRYRDRWNKCAILIIDEISMIDAELFNKLDYIGKIARRNTAAPFGGIQLILSGDFLQLPPVNNVGVDEELFCFESKAWREAITHCVSLRDVYRQKDAEFVRALNEIRHGQLTEFGDELLKECMRRTLDVTDGIEPTQLFPINRDVDKINSSKLGALPGKMSTFKSVDKGNSPFVEQLEGCQAPAELELKVGAQVMLLTNLDFKRGLVSGARGRVTVFDLTRKGFPRVLFQHGVEELIETHKWSITIEGRDMATREQVPLKLAWALSIHKCQGQTLDKVVMKLDNAFEYGQAYVALSRVTSPAGLKLLGYKASGIKAHPRVIEWYQQIEEQADGDGVGVASPTKKSQTVTSKQTQPTITTAIASIYDSDDEGFGADAFKCTKDNHGFPSDDEAEAVLLKSIKPTKSDSGAPLASMVPFREDSNDLLESPFSAGSSQRSFIDVSKAKPKPKARLDDPEWFNEPIESVALQSPEPEVSKPIHALASTETTSAVTKTYKYIPIPPTADSSFDSIDTPNWTTTREDTAAEWNSTVPPVVPEEPPRPLTQPTHEFVPIGDTSPPEPAAHAQTAVKVASSSVFDLLDDD